MFYGGNMTTDNQNSDALIAEYNSLRAECLDNCRGMVNLFLYIVIIIATIFGASISKGSYEPTMFLMPLIVPLLLVRNSLYRSNVRITHYVATQICPQLPSLGWSKHVERRVKRPVWMDLSSYRLLNFYYLAIAIVPNVVFIPGPRSVGFRILQFANVAIGMVVAGATVGCTRHRLLEIIAEQEDGEGR